MRNLKHWGMELIVIVVGVLIALGAESVVEGLRDDADVRAAEDAMLAEIRDNDLPQAYTRAALFQCFDQQLKAIEAAVGSGDRDSVKALAKAYTPIFRTWDDQAWTAAIASQVLVNAGTERMLAWSMIYNPIPVLSEAQNAERAQLPLLKANISGTGPLSAAQQDHLFELISRLRHYNGNLRRSSLFMMKFSHEAGVELSPTTKARLFADARKAYGACVEEPVPGQVDTESQLFAGVESATPSSAP